MYAGHGKKRSLSRPIPEKIKEAREGRGLRLEAFAEQLDVSKQAVAQYETGQISPSGEVMGKIVAVTGQPPAFFVTSRSRSGSPATPFWRSLKRMEQHHRKRITRRLEWARDIADYVEQFIHLPEIRLPPIEFDHIDGPSDEIEAAAEIMRDHWGLGRGPIRDLAAVMETNGIILLREPVQCADMDAVSCWQGGRPFVLFAAEVSSGPRTAFNLAHELGHIVLHAGVEINSQNLNPIEKQANRFASALLLPQESFSQEIFGTSIDHFKFLKQRWGVSISAMIYRCKDLGIFTTNQHQYLMKQMNSRGIRVREPYDEHFQVRDPEILAESIRMIVENEVQTKAQIELALNLNMSDVESICGVPSGYLDNRVVQFDLRPRLRDLN